MDYSVKSPHQSCMGSLAYHLWVVPLTGVLIGCAYYGLSHPWAPIARAVYHCFVFIEDSEHATGPEPAAPDIVHDDAFLPSVEVCICLGTVPGIPHVYSLTGERLFEDVICPVCFPQPRDTPQADYGQLPPALAFDLLEPRLEFIDASMESDEHS